MSPRLPSSDPSPVEHALALARQGAIAEALACLESLPQHGDEAPATGTVVAALAQLSHLAVSANDRTTAEGAIALALRLAPGFPDLHFQHACLLLESGRRPEGRKALAAALKLNPRYVAARVELALLDAREGFVGEALAALRSLGDDHRVQEPRAFQQGLKSLERADWEEAGALLKSALHLTDPQVEEALERYHVLRGAGDHVRAAVTLRATLDAHPAYPDLHYLMGVAELEGGMVDDAVASLARALELNPDFHDARVSLARALEALGDLAQAAEQVGLVLEAAPSHAPALAMSERWSRRVGARVRHSRARKGS